MPGRIPGAPDDAQPDSPDDDDSNSSSSDDSSSSSSSKTPSGIDGPVAGGSGDTSDIDGDSYQRGENSSDSDSSNESSGSSSGGSRPGGHPSRDKMRQTIGGSDSDSDDSSDSNKTPAGIDGPVAGGSGDTSDIDGDSYQRGENSSGSGSSSGDDPLPDAEQGIETGDDDVAKQARDLEQQVTDNDPFVSPEGVTVEREGDRLVARLNERGVAGERQRAETRARSAVMNQTDITNPENISVTWEDGRVSARPDEDWQRLQRAEAEQQARDRAQAREDSLDNIPGYNEAQRERAEQRAQARRDSFDNIPGLSEELSDRRRQRLEEERQQREDGDIVLTNPLTGNRVEDDLETAGDAVAQTSRRSIYVLEATGQGELAGGPIGSALGAGQTERDVLKLADQAGFDEAADQYRSLTPGEGGVATTVGRNLAFGTTEALNVPRGIADAKEMAEFANFAVDQTVDVSDADDSPEVANSQSVTVGDVTVSINEDGAERVRQTAESEAKSQANAMKDAFTDNPAGVSAAVIGGVGAGFAVGTGAARTARRAADAGTDVAGTTVRGARSAGSRVNSRTPTVSIERNPDAGLIEVDPMLRQQIRDTVPTERSDLPSPRDAVGRARTSIDNTITKTQLRAAVKANDIGNVPSRPSLRNILDENRQRASDAATRAQFRASVAMNRDRSGSISDRISDGLSDRLSGRGGPSGTTNRDVFGGPMSNEWPVRRQRASSEPTTSDEVFGRPMSSELGEASISERLRGLSDISTPRLRGWGFSRSELSERVGDNFGPAGDSSREVFGRPMSSELDLFGSSRTSTSTSEVFGRARGGDLTIRFGPSRPPRRVDITDEFLDESDDLGPFASDEDFGDLDSGDGWSPDSDIAVASRDSGSGQQTQMRMRQSNEMDDDYSIPTRRRPRSSDRVGRLGGGLAGGLDTGLDDAASPTFDPSEDFAAPSVSEDTGVAESAVPGLDIGEGLTPRTGPGEGLTPNTDLDSPPTPTTTTTTTSMQTPSTTSTPTETPPFSPPKRPPDIDTGRGGSEDPLSGFGFATSSETFDTGVVQSLDELESKSDRSINGIFSNEE